MSSYLTPAEKARELESWTHEWDDEGIRPLLDPLNQLEGVCTVQSCIGHIKQTSTEQLYIENGHIEMRLDQKRTQLFYDAMPALRAVAGAECPEIHWRMPTEQRCIVWFYPGNAIAVVAALLDVLGKDDDAGARLDPNPGAITEARCL